MPLGPACTLTHCLPEPEVSHLACDRETLDWGADRSLQGGRALVAMTSPRGCGSPGHGEESCRGPGCGTRRTGTFPASPPRLPSVSVHAKLLSRVQHFATPPDSSVHGFLRQNTGVGCPALLQGDALPDPGINGCLLRLLHRRVGSLPLEPPGRPSLPSVSLILHSSLRFSFLSPFITGRLPAALWS